MDKIFIQGDDITDTERLLYDEDERIIAYISDYKIISRIPKNKTEERAIMMFAMTYLYWNDDECVLFIEKLKKQEDI
ncbi:MAG: hypothetical protein RBR02_06225 [Desulfuromonadaceae bacterium]|nr:hypothetical protein [Desulfuromonadaceae bacterium]